MASSLPGDLKGLECYTSKLSKVPLLSSLIFFVFLLFCTVVVVFWGWESPFTEEEKRWVERSSDSSLMSNFVKSRCLRALKMQKSFFIGTITVSNQACRGKNDGN